MDDDGRKDSGICSRLCNILYNRINLAHLLHSCKAGHFSMLNILCNTVSSVGVFSMGGLKQNERLYVGPFPIVQHRAMSVQDSMQSKFLAVSLKTHAVCLYIIQIQHTDSTYVSLYQIKTLSH